MSAIRRHTGGRHTGPLFDPASPLVATGNLRRREIVSRVAVGGANLAALIAVAVLVLVVFEVTRSGIGQVSWNFLTTNASSTIAADGGIAAELVGTALIVAAATVIAVPLGILCALYLVEYARPGSRVASTFTLALDLMQGLPTIVVGLFAFGLLVKPLGHDSGFAGAIALTVVMLPLIARSSQEVLRLVPSTMRDAADALGVFRWRALLGVVLPAAAPGILTGIILAVARAAGETAPLLVTSSIFQPGTTFNIFGHGVPNVPVLILNSAEAPNPLGLARAWGAAFVLLAMILIANIAARVILARARKRMGAA